MAGADIYVGDQVLADAGFRRLSLRAFLVTINTNKNSRFLEVLQEERIAGLAVLVLNTPSMSVVKLNFRSI